MEQLWQDLGTPTLDMKHLIQNAPQQAKRNKVDKLMGEDLPDFSLAYLGPQIWSNTVMSDDLKLESINLDDLLRDTDEKELSDICSVSVSTEAAEDRQANECLLSTDHSEAGRPLLSLDNFNQYEESGLGYGSCSKMPGQIQLQDMPEAVSPRQMETPSKDFNFEPDITDVIISTPLDEMQGNSDLFDPSRRVFTDDELKPQPIIRKAKKVYVPNESKDARYWQKREKNNAAAKRSREARRIKENQIAMRTKFLEKENDCLRLEVSELRSEVKRLMEVVDGYKKGNK